MGKGLHLYREPVVIYQKVCALLVGKNGQKVLYLVNSVQLFNAISLVGLVLLGLYTKVGITKCCLFLQGRTKKIKFVIIICRVGHPFFAKERFVLSVLFRSL